MTRLSCLTRCSVGNICGMQGSIFITQLECLGSITSTRIHFFVLEAAPFNRDLLLEVAHLSPPTHCTVGFYIFPCPSLAVTPSFPSVWFIFHLPLTSLCPLLVHLSVWSARQGSQCSIKPQPTNATVVLSGGSLSLLLYDYNYYLQSEVRRKWKKKMIWMYCNSLM